MKYDEVMWFVPCLRTKAMLLHPGWYQYDRPAPTDPFRSADKAYRDKGHWNQKNRGRAWKRYGVVKLLTLNFWIFKQRKKFWRTSKPTGHLQASLCIREAIADRGSLPLPEHQQHILYFQCDVLRQWQDFQFVQSGPRIFMAETRTKSEPSACIQIHRSDIWRTPSILLSDSYQILFISEYGEIILFGLGKLVRQDHGLIPVFVSGQITSSRQPLCVPKTKTSSLKHLEAAFLMVQLEP